MSCILTNQTFSISELCGYGLSFSFGGLRTIYFVIALIMWAVTGIFSLEYMETFIKSSLL